MSIHIYIYSNIYEKIKTTATDKQYALVLRKFFDGILLNWYKLKAHCFFKSRKHCLKDYILR